MCNEDLEGKRNLRKVRSFPFWSLSDGRCIWSSSYGCMEERVRLEVNTLHNVLFSPEDVVRTAQRSLSARVAIVI